MTQDDITGQLTCMSDDEEMSVTEFRIAFDGDALASHTMDIRDLAPALLGLNEILVEANKVLNGDKASVEIHVTPKIEENCFDIGLEVFQAWQAVKDLLGSSNMVTAKELVEWVLLHKEISGVASTALVMLLCKLRGKRPRNIIHFNDENGNRLCRYQFDDQPDQIIDESLHRLYQNKRIRRGLSRLWKPLIQRDGVSEFRAYKSGKSDKAFKLAKAEASEIDLTDDDLPVEEDTGANAEPIEAWLKVYSPVYDMHAPRWRFWYGIDHYYMDVSGSNIREVVYRAGGVLINDTFRVRLNIDERQNDHGDPVTEFKVLKVLEFKPAARQTDMFDGSAEEDNRDT